MTLKEYQEGHYKLWDYIADRILHARRCLIIPDLKKEWLHANYKPDIANNCFIYDYLLGLPDSCEECLGGLYRECVLSTSYIEQYEKACEIRDIWGGNPT